MKATTVTCLFVSKDGRLAVHLMESPVPVPGGQLHVTASFGVASYGGGMSATDLFGVADAALYEAKAKGKDRVVAKSGALAHPAS